MGEHRALSVGDPRPLLRVRAELLNLAKVSITAELVAESGM